MSIKFEGDKVHIATTDGTVHTFDANLFKRWCNHELIEDVIDDAPLNIDDFFQTLKNIEDDGYNLDNVDESYLDLALCLCSPSYIYRVIENIVSHPSLSNRVILRTLALYPNQEYNKRLYYTACLQTRAEEYIRAIIKDPREAVTVKKLWLQMRNREARDYFGSQEICDMMENIDCPQPPPSWFKSESKVFQEKRGKHIERIDELFEAEEMPEFTQQKDPKSRFNLLIKKYGTQFIVDSNRLHYCLNSYLALESTLN